MDNRITTIDEFMVNELEALRIIFRKDPDISDIHIKHFIKENEKFFIWTLELFFKKELLFDVYNDSFALCIECVIGKGEYKFEGYFCHENYDEGYVPTYLYLPKVTIENVDQVYKEYFSRQIFDDYKTLKKKVI